MRLRVKELLTARAMTAYALAKASRGRISLSAAYRLASDDSRVISLDVLEILCEVLEISDPGPLFSRGSSKKGH